MSDIKEKLAPMLKMIEQLDSQSVMAICGVMLLLTVIFGGIADVIVLVAGIWIGIAICKKMLS